tara:strand:- start:13313 stop:13612 length:300 start_codon:yes stop_codon:yes gene_type:complete
MNKAEQFRLPVSPRNISVELVREVEDEDTGEVVAEHIIEVFGRFLPAEPNVGLGPHIEVLSAHRQDRDVRVPVELEDWEVDTLLDLYQEQLRTELDRDI